MQDQMDGKSRILFLQRSNGQWWLPGGNILPKYEASMDAILHWTGKLLTGGICPLQDGGTWCLSPEAGNYEVHQFIGYEYQPETVRLSNPSSDLSRSLSWFDSLDIHEHLYEHRDMPWGQAKMAVYALHDFYKDDRRAAGDLLRDDLGEAGGKIWKRPT